MNRSTQYKVMMTNSNGEIYYYPERFHSRDDAELLAATESCRLNLPDLAFKVFEITPYLSGNNLRSVQHGETDRKK